MNDCVGPFRKPGPGRAVATVWMVLALTGCADLRRSVSLPPVNPESPVAATVAAAARRQYDVPRLVDVPPSPKDIPAAADVKLGVVSMVRCRGGLQRFAATHPPLSSGAEAYASDLRAFTGATPADVPPPDSASRSEAAAADLRAYAAPPSALASGPPPTAADAQPPVAAPPTPRTPHSTAARPRRPALAPAPPPAAVAEAPVAAGPPSAAMITAAPALPAPLPDPMLARCS